MLYTDIPNRNFPVIGTLKRKGKYIDNGILSNTTRLNTPIVWRGRTFHSVEAAYVAEKNPYVIVEGVPFIDHVVDWCKYNHLAYVKSLGKPKARGGKIDPVPNWDDIRISVMMSLLSLKYQDPFNASWLLTQTDEQLVEHNNWGDRFWGAVLREDETSSRGRNILGELHILIRNRSMIGRVLPVPEEAEWIKAQNMIICHIVNKDR